MNTERLYELLLKLTGEVERVAVTQRLDELIQHITNQVNEPANGVHQTNFSQVFERLRSETALSWFVQLTPLESDVLEKMGLGILVGRRLPNRVVSLMRDNGMLPAVVRDELTKINEEIKRHLKLVSNTITSFQSLGFDEGELDEGVGELALRIPREVIGQRFGTFIEDAQFLKELIGVTVELIEGKHEDLTLRALSSSDYGIFLEVVPQVAAFTVLAIERTMALYKTVLEVRVLRDQLKQRAAPEVAIAAIEEDIEKRIKQVARKGLDEALKESKAKAPKERANELKNHAASLFTKLIQRLENGYDLDARVGHAENPPEGEDEKAAHEKLVATDQQVRRGIKAVRKQISESQNLKALEFKPEPSSDAEDSDDSDE